SRQRWLTSSPAIGCSTCNSNSCHEGRPMTRKNTWVRFVVALALSLPLAACKDTKTLQENEQLKAHVAELQKENGQVGNDLETMTANRDELGKEKASLKE